MPQHSTSTRVRPSPSAVPIQDPITLNSTWRHRDSGNIYEVVELNGTSSQMIKYRSADENSRIFQLSRSLFLERLEPASTALEVPDPTPDSPSGDETSLRLGTMIRPSEDHVFDKMVLYPAAVEQLTVAIHSIRNQDKMKEIWKMKGLQRRNVINCYGLPGTGKTLASLCIARIVGKPLYQVNFGAILSQFVNEPARRVTQMFDEAKRVDAIMLIDEADTLISKRADLSEGSNHPIRMGHNAMVNAFMQALDKFDGIVILTTNFFKNFDPAMLRRINRHVEFQLPSREMRRKLIELNMPPVEVGHDRMMIDVDRLSVLTDGFSGGDINTLCLNSVETASLDPDTGVWKLTDDLMERETASIKASKVSHAQPQI